MGLQSIAQDDPEYAQVVCGKDAALEHNDKRVYFAALLPVEVANRIILNIPYTSKEAGSTISSAWRKRIFACTETWTRISTGDDDFADRQVASSISQLAQHVECLTIDSQDQKLCLKYLLSMRSSQFSKSKWPYLKGTVLRNAFHYT